MVNSMKCFLFTHKYLMLLSTALMMIFVISSCGTHRKSVELITKDSVQTDIQTRVETRIEWKHDTVYFEIPSQGSERTTLDTISSLNNDFARSTAKILPDGSLYHDLYTIPQKIAKETDIPIEHKDSVRTEIQYKYIAKTEKIPEYIEKELNLWQRICIKGFPISILLILIFLAWKFRSPLISTLNKVIKLIK